MRLLILGAGAVVTEFYLPALAWLGVQWKVTVADLSIAALARVSSRAPWIQTVQSGYEEAINISDGFDAVVVALPNWLHVDACSMALRKGLPVLCEKPLALSRAECQSLASISHETQTPLEVAMVRRLTPANQAAAQVLASGVVGKISRVVVDHGSPYGWLSDSGAFFKKENGGILADLGVHQLDWLASVLGPLRSMSYRDDARGGVEADCEYELQTENGIPVTLRLSYRRLYSNKAVFFGDRAELHIDKNDFEKCQIVGIVAGASMQVRPERPFDDNRLPYNFDSCFVQQLTDFSRVVKKEKSVRVSADDAASTIGLIESAYGSRAPSPQNITPITKAIPQTALESGKTVVTGGTGFIGGHLLERLTDLGFKDLAVPVRNFRTCVNAARFPVDLQRADLSNRDDVRKLVAGSRWVFHLAYGLTEADAAKVTIDATKLLIEESVRAGAEAIVVLSTMGVFGHPDSQATVDESSPYDPAYGSYGKTKAAMEQWILSPERQFGPTRVVVLNPTCVYGPEGKTYTRLPLELASRREFAWVNGGCGIANHVYVENLVDAMLLVASDIRANRNRYLVNDGSCTWRQFLSQLLGSYAAGIPDLHVEDFSAEAVAIKSRAKSKDLVRHLTTNLEFVDLVNRHPVLGPLKKIALKLGRKRLESLRHTPLVQSTPKMADKAVAAPHWLPELFGPTNSRFSSDRLRSLGWNPRLSFEEGMQRTCKWLRESGFGL